MLAQVTPDMQISPIFSTHRVLIATTSRKAPKMLHRRFASLIVSSFSTCDFRRRTATGGTPESRRTGGKGATEAARVGEGPARGGR